MNDKDFIENIDRFLTDVCKQAGHLCINIGALNDLLMETTRRKHEIKERKPPQTEEILRLQEALRQIRRRSDEERSMCGATFDFAFEIEELAEEALKGNEK